MDGTNLKAYYRQSCYMELAKSEDADRVSEGQTEEWIASEYWDKADADANSILVAESENKQGKNLKADIRKSKLDLETKSKYNLKTSGLVNTKNSVYKVSLERCLSKEVPAVSRRYHKPIQKQQKEEQERVAAAILKSSKSSKRRATRRVMYSSTELDRRPLLHLRRRI